MTVISQESFSDCSREVDMATNLGQNWQTDLHLAPWHLKRIGILHYR